MGKSPFLEGSNEGGRRRMVEMLNLPVDMIKEILLWLPVKSLLRFRCVSKDWRCLITDSSFINQHHNRSTEKKPNLILTDTRSFYTVKDNSCHKLDIPYLNSLDWSYKIKVLGSCNSLLCFGLLAAGVFPVTIHYREPIYLMNLSTREVKKLPYAPSEIPQSTDRKTRIGIGYDPISKDYKVVLSVYSNIMFRSCNVWVYSLNSNNWRKLGDIPVPDLYPKTYNYSQSALAFNAAIHWIVFWKNELIGSLWNSIYTFDLVYEVFRELPLPFPPGKGHYIDLVVIRGYFSVLRDPWDQISYEIWTMKEYGVKESWTKQIIVFHFYKQVRFWNDESLYQHFGNELVLYNIKSNTERNVEVHGLPIVFQTFIHTESLVMLEDTGEKRKKNKNPISH